MYPKNCHIILELNPFKLSIFDTNLFGCNGGGLKDLLAAAFGLLAAWGGSLAVCLLFGPKLIFGTRLIKGFCLSNTSLMCLLGTGFCPALQGFGGRFLGGLFGGVSWYCCRFGTSLWPAFWLLGMCLLLEELPECKLVSKWGWGALVGGEGGVCLVVGMMGTQGLEEEAAGEGTTSNRLLSVSSNSKLESLSWEKKYEVNI